MFKVVAATVLIAGGGHALCLAVALPTAFFIAKIAPRWIAAGLIVSMLLPLWAGYIVKAYAWRAMLSPAGNRLPPKAAAEAGSWRACSVGHRATG